jgi:hypothetical protein
MSGAEDPWWQERTAHHEAGHAVVARLLGRGVEAVTIIRGLTFGGVCLLGPRSSAAGAALVGVMPAVRLPPAVRQELEVEAMVFAAGTVAVGLFDQAPARHGDRLAERVEQRLARDTAGAPALTAEERASVAAAVADTDPGESDDEAVARLAAELNPNDLTAAVLHVAYLEASTRTLLSRNAAAVHAVADALLAHRKLGSEHVSRLILEARAGGDP